MIRIGIDLIQIVHKSGEPRIERHSHLTHFVFNLKHRKISTFANLRLGHGPPPSMGLPIRIPFCLSYINHTLHTSCKSSSLGSFRGTKKYRHAKPPECATSPAGHTFLDSCNAESIVWLCYPKRSFSKALRFISYTYNALLLLFPEFTGA